MRRLLKFYRYAFEWENYQLLARTIYAAWLVRRHLDEQLRSPHLSAVLPAVNKLYLSPQPNWNVSDPKRIALFASFVVNFPISWGKCAQQSLVMYRLLNGYGIPAKICFGIDRGEPEQDGHAWLITPAGVFAEDSDPRERFKTVYISPRPATEEMG